MFAVLKRKGSSLFWVMKGWVLCQQSCPLLLCHWLVPLASRGPIRERSKLSKNACSRIVDRLSRVKRLRVHFNCELRQTDTEMVFCTMFHCYCHCWVIFCHYECELAVWIEFGVIHKQNWIVLMDLHKKKHEMCCPIRAQTALLSWLFKVVQYDLK